MSRRNGSKGLYQRVLALKDNGSEPDPEVPGLTYEARMTKTGIRLRSTALQASGHRQVDCEGSRSRANAFRG